MKQILIVLFILPVFVCCQNKAVNGVIYSRTYLNNDTTVTIDSSMGYHIKHTHYKSGIDSSNWRLYKIYSDTFYYFKIVGYGELSGREYPVDSVKKWNAEYDRTHKKDSNVLVMGYNTIWDNAVGYYTKLYMKASYLLDKSKIKDTIPIPINHYSEVVNADNPNAAYGHTIVKYYVGGIFGEYVREIHLDDAKKRKP